MICTCSRPAPGFITKILVQGLMLLSAMILCMITEISVEAEPLTQVSSVPEPRWWKGNMQTQSYWSDGDQFPEEVCAWYKNHGFNFVALSDHDRPPVGEFWKNVGVVNSPVNISAEVHPQILALYREKYGNEWVKTRELEGHLQVRLKPVEEFGPLLNESQRFLVMPSHQIYTKVEDEHGLVSERNPGVAWLDIVNSVTAITSAQGRD